MTRQMKGMPRQQRLAAILLLAIGVAGCAASKSGGTSAKPSPDPRIGLKAGWMDAGEAKWNVALIAHRARSKGFFNADKPGEFDFANTDLAFTGNYLFQGSYNGVQVWDISEPANPRLRVAIICPGGQGDVSVHGDLLFMSVEETRGRLDCGTKGVADTVSADRLRGIRIYDIRDIDRPRPITTVQTCRGSHTHTLVSDPKDSTHIYVYVSGTGKVRSAAELAGCSGATPEEDPNTSLFRIEVIRVPLAAPQNARVVSAPRIFANASGSIAGLQKADTTDSLHKLAETNRCHDITAYSALGLAAGACAGNGILLDISNPAQPRRIAEVSDPNFAYWHSATFNNDGTKILFTDEWGGGTAARCRATDRRAWGANAFYNLSANRMTPAGMYKLPVPQTDTENCVAHNGSLVPVPGRDIIAQAWYQGGLSVLDFTDPANPIEIAYFDRGPLSATELMLGGYWSTYWYNGRIYGSDIARGLDVLELQPSALLSQNEIDAARLVRFDRFNAQDQQRFTWPPSFVVARAYLDQLRRGDGLSGGRIRSITRALERAEKLTGDEQRRALVTLSQEIEGDVTGARDAARVRALSRVTRELSGTTR